MPRSLLEGRKEPEGSLCKSHCNKCTELCAVWLCFLCPSHTWLEEAHEILGRQRVMALWKYPMSGCITHRGQAESDSNSSEMLHLFQEGRGSPSHGLTITGSFFLTPEVLHTDCASTLGQCIPIPIQPQVSQTLRKTMKVVTRIFPAWETNLSSRQSTVPHHDLLCSVGSCGGSRSYLDVPEITKPWAGMGKSVPGLDFRSVLAGGVLEWIPGGTQMSPHSHCPALTSLLLREPQGLDAMALVQTNL